MSARWGNEAHWNGHNIICCEAVIAIPLWWFCAWRRSRHKVADLRRTRIDLDSECQRTVIAERIQRGGDIGCYCDIPRVIDRVERVEVVLASMS